ncbi:Protein strawberry notch 1 [Folsomia candida]|uniref:Protein strawberry notch 1 n=1 Tax=Folsomia candida TaxID=158441 RepID=A0A226CTS5_FOLCA|nr:Protein strawberry notch 1 [Folsomia candida]
MEPEEEISVVGVSETYSEVHMNSHPDPIVKTASLNSVPSPLVSYKLRLPASVSHGKLSSIQLDAIEHACQQHEYMLSSGGRTGFLIGDGAGVGKGRTIAGLIYENWRCGRRKALWLSVSPDLIEDSKRDLADIGAREIKISNLTSIKCGEKVKYPEGVMFLTYSSLIGQGRVPGKGLATRIDQIIAWVGKYFEGLILFDECHQAKNLCPGKHSRCSKTGSAVEALQNVLLKARVVYASATGASEPRNMAYMTRGIVAMEMVAMDMKLRGAYIARQLSFNGVDFRIEKIPKNFPKCTMERRKAVQDGKCVVIGIQSTGEAITEEEVEKKGQVLDFVSITKCTLLSLIRNHCPSPTQKEIRLLRNDKARSGTRPAPPKRARLDDALLKTGVSYESLCKATNIRCRLLKRIEDSMNDLPKNTLDYLIYKFGAPSKVAEGEKKRLIKTGGKVINQKRDDGVRGNLEATSIRGKKFIISEAASCGISLHSDRRVVNKRRRVHITLELPWSAESAIQQFGRTHRSNQINAPEYVLLASELAGEHRFTSLVAKRLESLGALTHGDRRANDRDLSHFHIDNTYGQAALKNVMGYITGEHVDCEPVFEIPNFRNDVTRSLTGAGLISPNGTMNIASLTISKFLNRIMGTNLAIQKSLFRYFTDSLETLVSRAKSEGTFDRGILDLGVSSAEHTRHTGTKLFERQHATGIAKDTERKLIVLVAATTDFVKAVNKYLKDIFFIHHQAHRKTMSEVKKLYSILTTSVKAKTIWNSQYTNSADKCIHVFQSQRSKSCNGFCQVGKSLQRIKVLCGSVLLCWSEIESVLRSQKTKDLNNDWTLLLQCLFFFTESSIRLESEIIDQVSGEVQPESNTFNNFLKTPEFRPEDYVRSNNQVVGFNTETTVDTTGVEFASMGTSIAFKTLKEQETQIKVDPEDKYVVVFFTNETRYRVRFTQVTQAKMYYEQVIQGILNVSGSSATSSLGSSGSDRSLRSSSDSSWGEEESDTDMEEVPADNEKIIKRQLKKSLSSDSGAADSDSGVERDSNKR